VRLHGFLTALAVRRGNLCSVLATTDAGDGTEVDQTEVDRPTGAEPTWDSPSWEDVVRLHGARVYRLAYRLTGNAHDAEDLTQETFVRVFRSLSRYQPGTFEGWLHRITTNLFLDGARRRARIRFDALGDDGERIPSAAPTPDRIVLDSRFEADVEAALAALPRDFRVAVVLADIEQLPYEEIAQILDVKIGTVRSRIHRGRTQLRAALATRDPKLRVRPSQRTKLA
jgi:RNA polymerase sigma-70 factor (ECF subfamily)